MIEITGKFNTAKIFTDHVESSAQAQIIELCNQEFTRDSKIRIMSDVHAGAGCTIGTTMTIEDKVVPNLVGVDIGCGMYVVKLKEKHVELQKLDKVIQVNVPSGFEVRKKVHRFASKIDLSALKCVKEVNLNRAELSIGTLGGGNHFIEVNKDEDGKLYLVIHSGSRHLGKQIAEYYQLLAYKELTQVANEASKINKQLAYLTGSSMEHYMDDIQIAQSFATLNREVIADEIIRNMGWKVDRAFTTIHNYIETDTKILRKGAVSAKAGEELIIPINMRDGSLLCVGKGNNDWNNSAPHGAGRLMSRSAAKESLNMNDFKESMKGIYTTSVSKNTIDESPMAYKPIQEILNNIKDTVELVKIIKPVYNFKAGGE